MGCAQLIRCFTFFFYLCLSLSSGSSVAKKPPLKPTHQTKKPDNQENRVLFSFSKADTTPTTIPIVNPTTPSTTTPIVGPIATPPPSTITGPTIIYSPPPPSQTIIGPPTTPTTGPPTTPTTSSGSWCIASTTASETALQVALDYACGYGGADCSAIQQGGSCYNPNSLRDHASYAFNQYYQKNPSPTSCVFGGTAQLTSNDPSSGSCRYSASSSLSSPTPPSMSTPVSPTTPFGSNPPPDFTPPYITTPNGSTDDGTEPSASPNSAVTLSSSLWLLLTVTTLVASHLASNYL